MQTAFTPFPAFYLLGASHLVPFFLSPQASYKVPKPASFSFSLTQTFGGLVYTHIYDQCGLGFLLLWQIMKYAEAIN